MAPHLSPEELDVVADMISRQAEATTVHAALCKTRKRRGVAPPKIWAVRRAMRGRTHKRSRVETRGRKAALTPAQARRLDASRRKLITNADAEYEVTYAMITKHARLSASRFAAARALRPLGVRWRSLRQKPPRTSEHEAQRVDVCKRWKRRPSTFWSDDVDLIIDNKKFAIPTTAAARKRLRQTKVRAVHRTAEEGLQPGFTKPNARKHKSNPGGSVSILAGIQRDRIVVWEEVTGRWNAQQASAMYAGPIRRALQRTRPGKRSWLIMEDNDPAGYKSNQAKETKRSHHMRTLNQPPYSPDLNPLDFSIWHAIETRASKGSPRGRETTDAFKSRLRRIAMRLPRREVRKAVVAIRKRADAIFKAKGKHIRMD